MSEGPRRLGAQARALLAGPGLAAVLGRGTLGSLVLGGLGTLAGLLWHMMLSRWLGADHFGDYIYTWTLMSLVVIVATLGMDTALVRFVASYRVSERWGALAGLLRFGDRLVLATSCGVGLAFALAAWGFAERIGEPLSSTLIWGAVGLPPMALVGLRVAALQGTRRVVLSKLPDVLLRPLLVVLLCLGWLAATGSLTAPGAMIATGLALSLALVVGHLLLRPALPRELAGVEPERHGREWLRVSVPLLLVAGMRQLMTQADVLLIGPLLGTREAGLFTAAARLGQLITYGQNNINPAAAPLISELHTQGDRAGLQRIVTLASWGATVWAVGAAGVLILGGRWLLGLWGPEFPAAHTVLVILAVGQVINALAGPVGYLLNMTGHQDVNARILFWTVGLDFALNLPAILWLGAPGAALTTALLTAVKNIWTWVEVRRRLGINCSVFRFGGGS